MVILRIVSKFCKFKLINLINSIPSKITKILRFSVDFKKSRSQLNYLNVLNVIVFAFLLLLQLHLVKNLIQRKAIEKFQVFFIFIFFIMLTVRNLPDSIISWLMLNRYFFRDVIWGHGGEVLCFYLWF